MKIPRVIPYVVGQWVRGPRFYGRTTLIAEVLDGHRDSIWFLGLRRIGKTSLLRQIELVAADGPRRYFPVFWDLQGAEDVRELTESFREALLEVEERLRGEEIEVDDVSSDDLIASIQQVRRRLRDRGLTMLLLCDEAEALIAIQRGDPAVIRKLARIVGSTEGIRTVIASTIRLAELSKDDESSSLLDGFTPPSFMRGLEDDEARSLVRQTQEPLESRPEIDDADVERVRTLCGNHPYLIQLLAKRYLELGSLESAREQVEGDPMLSHFFAVDLGTLDDDERTVLHLIAAHDPIAEETIRVESRIEPGWLSVVCRRLEGLGLIDADGERRYSITTPLFRSWLTRIPSSRREREPRAGHDESRIGEWAIRRDLNEIRRGEDVVRLEPRAMNLLVYLASRPGRVIGKDEIFDALWEGVFVSESALTRTIADLRKALGDDAKNPQYIATISKRGYRLVAPVIGLPDDRRMPHPVPGAGGVTAKTRFYLTRGLENLPLTAGELWIGRDPACTITIPSPKVSRRHARLTVDANGVSIDDPGSRNGTTVNGLRLGGAKGLRNGDVIVVGPETLIFRTFDPADVTASDLDVPSRGSEGDGRR